MRDYLNWYRDEQPRLEALCRLLTAYPVDLHRTRRDNMDGHLTASGVVLQPETGHVLALHHATLGRILPPGGHIDEGDSGPLSAALREIQEETGIAAEELRLVPSPAGDAIPLDLDSHLIPASASKQEPAHYHHDFRYLFEFTSGRRLPSESPESGEFLGWVSAEEAFANTRLLSKLQQLRPHV